VRAYKLRLHRPGPAAPQNQPPAAGHRPHRFHSTRQRGALGLAYRRYQPDCVAAAGPAASLRNTFVAPGPLGCGWPFAAAQVRRVDAPGLPKPSWRPGADLLVRAPAFLGARRQQLL